MNPEPDVRLLTRAKWVGVLLPIAFIWGFEIVRWWVVEPRIRSVRVAHLRPTALTLKSIPTLAR